MFQKQIQKSAPGKTIAAVIRRRGIFGIIELREMHHCSGDEIQGQKKQDKIYHSLPFPFLMEGIEYHPAKGNQSEVNRIGKQVLQDTAGSAHRLKDIDGKEITDQKSQCHQRQNPGTGFFPDLIEKRVKHGIGKKDAVNPYKQYSARKQKEGFRDLPGCEGSSHQAEEDKKAGQKDPYRYNQTEKPLAEVTEIGFLHAPGKRIGNTGNKDHEAHFKTSVICHCCVEAAMSPDHKKNRYAAKQINRKISFLLNCCHIPRDYTHNLIDNEVSRTVSNAFRFMKSSQKNKKDKP
jgi:hypothetical protein